MIKRSTGKGLPAPWVQRWLVKCDGGDLRGSSGSFSREVSLRAVQWPREGAGPQQQDQTGTGSTGSLIGAARTAEDRTDSKRLQQCVDFLQRSPLWQLRLLLLEGFESDKRHIRFTKFIGWLLVVSKSLLLARFMYQKFAVHSSGVSKVCCSLSVSTTSSINSFQQDASFSKMHHFLKVLLKVS